MATVVQPSVLITSPPFADVAAVLDARLGAGTP